MRIVFALPGRGSSGGVRCTAIMANALLERGHDVRIIYQRQTAPIDVMKWLRDRMVYSGVSDWLDQFKGRVDAFGDIRKCHFDDDEIIVAVGMAMCAELTSVMSLPNRKLQYVHGATPWLPEIREKALKLPLPKIVVASYLKGLVEEIGCGDVLAVINNGIYREEYFTSVPESERDGVGVIYSCHSAKDPETTLAVLEKLSQSRPQLPLRVFSSDKRPPQIEPQYFSRYPSLEQAREIYSRSLVWILASNSEGFPAPVLEAMACGCCVVATDCGGTRDSIVDGENGFIVPVGDVEQIVKKVELLLDDEDLRTRMRCKARKTVEAFTWEKCVHDLEGVLRSIV